jgi:hypothetical protein
MTIAKTEAEYQLYVTQMVTLYREVQKAHTDYKLKMVEVKSYSEMTEIVKHSETVSFEVKTIKQHEVTVV